MSLREEWRVLFTGARRGEIPCNVDNRQDLKGCLPARRRRHTASKVRRLIRSPHLRRVWRGMARRARQDPNSP
jgi:hypothetical protein